MFVADHPWDRENRAVTGGVTGAVTESVTGDGGVTAVLEPVTEPVTRVAPPSVGKEGRTATASR
jgi:hypothetical protein